MKLVSPFLDALQSKVLIFDGAMGTQLQAANLTAKDFDLVGLPSLPEKARLAADRLALGNLEGCNEILNLTRPDVVEQIHHAYFRAGADIVETNTFGNSSIVLADYDIPELDYELALAAAQIARRAADQHPGKFVAGAIGPGTKLVSLGQCSWDELVDTYRRSFVGLIEGGSDVLMLETLQDLLMVKATIQAARLAMAETAKRLPLIVQFTIEQTGTMLLGTEIQAAINMVEMFPEVCVIGMNCATGPVEMTPNVRILSQCSTRPISVLPNAGLPVMENGQSAYKLTPGELAEHHEHFVRDLGVAMVGGCCGTTPAHISEVASRLSGAAHTADCHWRRVSKTFAGWDFEMSSEAKMDALGLVGCSSLYQFQPYDQAPSYLIVGEKTNANGSKAFREMLARDDWDAITEIGQEMEQEGSHLLDVCAAFVGRDEARDIREILSRFNTGINVPIMIDSTEAGVIEEALKCLAGKPIINSINFEDGEQRTDKVLGLCRDYGAGVVALTIDEAGMAKSATKKVEIARRIMAKTRSYGIADHDVFLDCLTFTLGSGDEEFRRAAVETLDAIEQVHAEFPRVNTILGVSNISFGLSPATRIIVNSVFLHYAREVGLTSAIVHFSKIRPENQIDSEIWKIASDLVFDRREYAEV